MMEEMQRRITELEEENALLRAELWEQWELNHSEHCGEWPHPHRPICTWPLPPILHVTQPKPTAVGKPVYVSKMENPVPFIVVTAPAVGIPMTDEERREFTEETLDKASRPQQKR